MEVVEKVQEYTGKKRTKRGQPRLVGSMLLSGAYTWILTAKCKHEALDEYIRNRLGAMKKVIPLPPLNNYKCNIPVLGN